MVTRVAGRRGAATVVLGSIVMRSEREKMLAGELYDPLDPELAAERPRKEYGKPIDVGSDVWVGGAR